MSGLRIEPHGDGATLSIRVQPRARKPGVGGLHGEALKVAVSAPPVDGAANVAVVAALAKKLGVSRSQISILRGLSGRDKVVLVEDITPEALERLTLPWVSS